MINVIGLTGFAIGMALVCIVAFFAGKKGWWWLVVLISLPALGGALKALTADMSSMSFIFRNFIVLVLVQLAATAAAYVFGRKRASASAIDASELK